jgi:hypothetical protein
MHKTLASLTVAAILGIPTAALAQDQGADPASPVSRAPAILAQAQEPNEVGSTAGPELGQRGPWTDMRYDNFEGGGTQ